MAIGENTSSHEFGQEYAFPGRRSASQAWGDDPHGTYPAPQEGSGLRASSGGVAADLAQAGSRRSRSLLRQIRDGSLAARSSADDDGSTRSRGRQGGFNARSGPHAETR